MQRCQQMLFILTTNY